MSQGLLLWLLLSPSAVWASRGHLRPLCQPINATLAAENEACPVCITFTTSICAGYCPSMVSSPNGLGPHFSQSTITSARPKMGGGSGAKRVAPGQGHSYSGGLENQVDTEPSQGTGAFTTFPRGSRCEY